MNVPITSDLDGYRAFWASWFGLLIAVVGVLGIANVVLLFLIWRKLP